LRIEGEGAQFHVRRKRHCEFDHILHCPVAHYIEEVGSLSARLYRIIELQLRKPDILFFVEAFLACIRRAERQARIFPSLGEVATAGERLMDLVKRHQVQHVKTNPDLDSMARRSVIMDILS
jgi:hypothetical protein